jgi:hypothetical protein
MDDYSKIPDKTAPGPVSNVSETVAPGGVTFHYTLPNDEDLRCVKAVYVDDRGVLCEVRASSFVDSLTIDGFGNTEPKTVKLIAVDDSNNESTPVVRTVIPGEPVIYAIAESVIVLPYWGGVQLSWYNPSKTDIALELFAKDFTGKFVSINSLYSRDEWGTINSFSGLEAVETEFAFYVRDRWGNKSPMKYFTETPNPYLMNPNFEGNKAVFVEQFLEDPRVQALDKLTYETWVKFDQYSPVSPNIQSIMGQEESTRGCLLRIRNNLLHFVWFGEAFILSSPIVPINEWIHLAMVYDGTTVRVYMNFQELITINSPGRLVNLQLHHANDPSFSIGQSLGSRFMYGQIRETRVWTTARTLDEIIMNRCGVDPTTPGLVGYWKFNEREGDIFKDSSPSGYDLLNAATSVTWQMAPGCD